MPTATRSAAGLNAPAPLPRVGTKTTKRSRLRACLLLVAFAGLLAPQAAAGSTGQLSLFQDDRLLLGNDPAPAMAEIRALGADIVRVNVVHQRIYTRPRDRRKPRGFDASNHRSARYNFASVDRFVQLAKANGISILMTVTGPGPFFTSSSPRRCRRVPCSFRPKPREFGLFAAAVAKRYRGDVSYYSIWNEPNIGKTWLTPRHQNTRFGRVDVAGAIYRKLFQAGYKAIARHDRGRRNRVLFGETAAIGAPLPMLRAALCLDPEGRPFSGRMRSLQGCSGRVARLNIGGVAIHPYNFGGYGNPQSRTTTKTSLPLAYMPRLHRLLDGAARRGRIGRRGKAVFVTEFGFQTRPPDPFGVSPGNQARFINESDRLFYGDRRIKSVAQYELIDVRQRNQFNTGLRRSGGQAKPAFQAYRIPIVVTRRSASSVEVYGQARPSRLLVGGPVTTVAIQRAPRGGSFATVAFQSTNRRGSFRRTVRGAGAARARGRLVWQNTDNGQYFTSRTAKAGKRLRYYRD